MPHCGETGRQHLKGIAPDLVEDGHTEIDLCGGTTKVPGAPTAKLVNFSRPQNERRINLRGSPLNERRKFLSVSFSVLTCFKLALARNAPLFPAA